MFIRELAETVHRQAQLYPVLAVTGPRQSGKTTLAKTLFPEHPYVSLENLDVRLRARQDPRGFLEAYRDKAIFDEVQHVPELLSYLQQIVDENPQKGRYIITGSQHFGLSSAVTQSLAGRIGMLTLLPLSLYELNNPSVPPHTAIFNGGYPGQNRYGMHPLEFYPNYIQTYVERDVRQISNIGDLGTFQGFLKLCAGRIGQLINFSSLAQDAGISHTTARQWLNILEATYIIFKLQPFHQNLNKRVIKMPKIYFYDTGLASVLLGLEQDSQIESHYLKGSLFENLIVCEVLKSRMNKGLPPNLYFWRDVTGHEVDLIGEWGGRVRAMEVKYGATLQDPYLRNLKYFADLYGDRSGGSISSYLAYTGEQTGTYAHTHLCPMHQVHDILGST